MEVEEIQQAEDAEEAEDFEVEGILGHEARTTGTGKRKKTEDYFLVRWVGYGSEHNTWEPRTSLGDCAGHIKDFEDSGPSTSSAKKTKTAKQPKGAGNNSAVKAENGKHVMELSDDEGEVYAAGDGDKSVEDCVDHKLWRIQKNKPPANLPPVLNTLEVFAGCGGMHFGGFGSFGNKQVEVKTLAAVEIEDVPSKTYAKNYPTVNVENMGVTRFLATARRLIVLKAPGGSGKKGKSGQMVKVKVVDMKICAANATMVRMATEKKQSTTARQNMDTVTIDQFQGLKALPWLMFQVDQAGELTWRKDCAELVEAVKVYLNGAAFGPHKFPLPGDVHVVTGGPPCQGWTGYNSTRIPGSDLDQLMRHSQNRLLLRFLECVWLYKPLYVIMEEVPAVAKESVMDFIKEKCKDHSYAIHSCKKIITGLHGCPQTRARLIVICALEGLPLPALPEGVTQNWSKHAEKMAAEFSSSDLCYPRPMLTAEEKAAGAKMRGLVLGDSAGCDLPRRAFEVDNKTQSGEGVSCAYTAAPSTPYIAYLRKTMKDGAEVTNHVMQQWGLSDQLRVAGFAESYIRAPHMMVLTPAQLATKQGKSMRGRYALMIPQYMRVAQKGTAKFNAENKAYKEEGVMPALTHGYKLQPNRFPLVPFWSLTKNMGRDHDCYGRLSYDAPHATVHSYDKPHWHKSLKLYENQVLSVREKARVQGFPDTFEFLGTVKEQVQQIANAVSPQLAIFLARSILTAHAEALGFDPTAQAARWSPSLQSFGDFMQEMEEAGEDAAPRFDAAAKRYQPPAPEAEEKCDIDLMSYEEVLVCFNTQALTKHSTRYELKTPFEVLDDCEDMHSWQLEKVVGMRQLSGFESEIAAIWRGFENVEWSPYTFHKDTLAYKFFEEKVGAAELKAVMSGKKPHCMLEGFDPKGETVVHPFLLKADASLATMRARYAKEKAAGWIKGRGIDLEKATAKGKGKAVQRKPRVKAGEEAEAEEDEDDEEAGEETDVESDEDI